MKKMIAGLLALCMMLGVFTGCSTNKQNETVSNESAVIGSTDAAAASQAGIKAASLVAMDPAPARYYHTRLDTADILIPEVMDKVLNIILQAVCDFDENGI